MNIRAMFAIIKDTFRESMATKMFWVLIGLSTLLIVAVAGIQIEELSAPNGQRAHASVSFYGLSFPSLSGLSSEVVKINVISYFFNGIAGFFGILISIVVTASFVSNLLEDGRISLYLSRPIKRYELLIAKYIGGVSFVFVQSSYLIVGLFLAFSLALNSWNFLFLWALPVLILLFSILYSFSVLLSLIFKKTGVIILVTIMFWSVCGILGQTIQSFESFLRINEPMSKIYLDAKEGKIKLNEDWMARGEAREVQMQSARKWLARLKLASYLVPPTTELGRISEALYQGKDSVKRMKIVETVKDGEIVASNKYEKVEVQVAMIKPILMCFGFILVCLSLSTFIFNKKEY